MKQALCPLDAIGEKHAKGFELDKIRLFAVKQDGRIYLYRNRCPHLGVPLEWQDDDFLAPDKAYIRCATHGALFTIDSGECLLGPCLGQSLQAIPYTVEEGNIVVSAKDLPALEPDGY